MHRHDGPSALVNTVTDDYIRPTDFQVATSYVHGLMPARPAPNRPPAPLTALADAIRPALEAGPTYVLFSGGRDSSAVLAVAAHVARAEGLPPPVPVTRIYPNHPDTDESRWQQLVVEHLDLDEWVRLTVHDENDLLGSGARSSLRRRGLLWPPALHVMDFTYDRLDPGTILTGEGGDQTLGNRRNTPVVRAMRHPLSRRRLARAGEALLPAPLRAPMRSRRLHIQQPWLRSATMERHKDLVVADDMTEPLSYDAATRWIGRRRAWHVLQHNAAQTAAEHAMRLANPLLDATFLAALGRFGGRLGFSGRTSTMQALFADLLPAALLTRSSKARFNAPYHGQGSRDFAESWDREGLDLDLVDPVRLQQEWRSDTPAPVAALLMQCAWLRQQSGGDG